MLNYYYKDSISNFTSTSVDEVIGSITRNNQFDSTLKQNKSWESQIPFLQKTLFGEEGEVFFEFSIPRMGKRIDALIIIKGIIFVIEFKVGESIFHKHDIEQVWDYALDLNNFHEPSHKAIIAPILIATEAKKSRTEIITTSHNDNLLLPILTGRTDFKTAIDNTVGFFVEDIKLNADQYAKGRYYPTPTIIEAALSLYENHTVDEITRNDASAKNLSKTTSKITEIIHEAKSNKIKTICFVTGVPGAGKTLVGLKVATTHLNEIEGNASVYLSGNGPLVRILQEALARDKQKNEVVKGNKITKKKS